MDRLIEWLPQHVPPGDETAIVHGDYRIDNVIFHPTEPRVLAVLDWELSTLGHPLSDFAYQVMAWRLTPQQFRGLKGCDFAALGIPTEDEYVAAYCRRTGRERDPALGRLPHLQHVPHRGDPARRARARAAGQRRERATPSRPAAAHGSSPTSPGRWRSASTPATLPGSH